jgi:hypothetical protein
MARTPRKKGSERNGYQLPADKLQQREAAFVIYRDMGATRSMHGLAETLKRDHPELAATRPRCSLRSWQLSAAAIDARAAAASPRSSSACALAAWARANPGSAAMARSNASNAPGYMVSFASQPST